MVKKPFFRPVCFILTQTFLWSVLYTDLSYAFGPQEALRPKAARQKSAALRTALVQTPPLSPISSGTKAPFARDGGEHDLSHYLLRKEDLTYVLSFLEGLTPEERSQVLTETSNQLSRHHLPLHRYRDILLMHHRNFESGWIKDDSTARSTIVNLSGILPAVGVIGFIVHLIITHGVEDITPESVLPSVGKAALAVWVAWAIGTLLIGLPLIWLIQKVEEMVSTVWLLSHLRETRRENLDEIKITVAGVVINAIIRLYISELKSRAVSEVTILRLDVGPNNMEKIKLLRRAVEEARRSGPAAQDGSNKTLGETFDEKLSRGDLYLKNPIDLDLVRKRGIAAIVLAGGEGTRMKPHLKHLFPFLGRPMSLWPILALREKGIPTVVVVGYGRIRVVEAFDREIPGLTYIEQTPPRGGTAEGLLQGLQALQGYDGPVLVINGDAAAIDGKFMTWLEKSLHQTTRDAIFVAQEVENPNGLGRILLSKGSEILKIVEQSEIDQGDQKISGRLYRQGDLKAIRLVNAGFYGFKRTEKLRQVLRTLRPFRTQPLIEYGIIGVIEAGLSAEAVTVPPEDVYKLIQPNDPESVWALEKEVLHRRSVARDGGNKNFREIFEGMLKQLKSDPHFQRKVDLAKQLERQGVKVRGGALSILLERIYIGPHVDISEFWDGVMDMGTRITGRSKIGRRSHLSGLINSSVIGENVKIIRGKEIDHSTIGNGSSLLSASISRYDIEDHVRIEDSYLSMRGKSTFGNGIEIAIGPEKERKPDLISDDRLTFKEIARIVMKRNDRLLLETHRRTAKEHANVLRSERGKVSQGATILRTKEIINAKIGEYAAIKNAEELHDVTVLSSRRYPSVINSGAIVSDTIVHEGTYIGERATVRNAIFMAHSGAKDNVVVEDAVIGPHSIMRFGHVVAFLAGPFVGKNHPSILIAGLWPGGMGNVGGHHTGSNHPSRGPTEEAYYPTAAFLGTNTDIIYPFSAETGILVGAGLVVPSQKILLPFSILTTPSISYNPRMNEILPGAGLTMTPYYYERVQYKNEEVNREKGTDIDTRIFTPEVINEMIRAVALLDRDPVSGKRITVEAVYTGEDYPGIGKNIMMEKSRGKAIEIYRFHISYYARKMLNARLEAIFETAPATWDEVKQELLLETDDEEWEYAKKLFERGIATWDKVFVIGLLEQFKEQENIYHVAVLHSKEKDEERRIGIFEVLDEAHIPFDRIPLVIKLKENHEATLRELGRLEERLLTLPVAGKDLPPSSNDGGTKSAPFVVALGGNAFEGETSDDQLPSLERMLEPVVELIKRGETVVITHGNGPQVGEGLLRIEIAAEKKEAPSMRLPYVGAQTQGSMGYMIASTLRRLLQKEGVPKEVVALITNVVVDTNDPAFQNPTKFIGKEYTKAETEQLSNERGWVFKEYKPGRWRRVVPSPLPREIVEEKIIQGLLEKGVIVVAAGGGGIPVSLRGLKGLDAVIDKDRTSALLAKRIGAEQFIILTAVDQVALDFGKPTQRAFSTLTMDEAKRYFAAGQFPAGSMGPKIEAAIDFLGNGGEKVIITDGQHLLEALEGKAGTTIVPTSKDGGTHLGLVEELLQKIARQRFTPIFGGAQARTIYLSEDLAIYDLQENTEVTLNHQTSPWAKAAKKRIKLVLRHLFGEDLSVGYGLESYRIAAALEDTYIDPFVILENVTLRIPKDGEEAVIHLRHAIVRERNDVFMVDILKELVQEGKLEEAMAKIEEVFRLDVWLIKEKRIVNLDLHFLKNTRIRNGRVVLRDLGYLTKDRDLALFFLTRLHQGGWEVAGGHPIEVTAQRLSHFAPPSLVNHYRTRAYEVYSIENFKHLWPDSDAFAHDDGSHFIEYQEVKHALRPMGIPIFEASEPVKGLIGLDEKGSVLWVDAFITQNSIPKALFDKILLPKLQFEKAIIEKGLPVAMEDEWVREVMALQPIGAGIVSLSEEEKEDLKNWIEARLLEGPREDLASLKELLSLNDVEEGTSRDGGGKGKWVTPEISPEIKKLLEEKVVSSIQIDSYTRIKNIVNPHGELQRGFYYASGGDAASFFLATNLTDALFVDFLPFGKEEGINDPLLLEWFLIDRTVWDSGFQRELSLRQLGGLKVPLLWDLVGMGAEIQGIRHIGRKTFEIHFNWAHPDDGKRIPRKITFFEKVDLIQPESYPKHLKKVLREGFDLYFMRGGGPLLQIGGLREGGYLVAPAGVVENNFWKEIDVPFGEGSFSIWEKKRGPAQDGGRRLLDLPRAGEFPLMQKPVEVGSGV
ncbi:MAG: carbamate kinase [Candidatus Omnitrophica bacterium]|nr:carbamate kinase [Candidatus Omnitrophota bacterium]